MSNQLKLVWIGIWALGTIGVCTLLWGPVQSRAQEAKQADQPAEPVFVADGVRMQIALAPDTPLAVTQKPRLVLTATNPTADEVTTRVRVQLTSQRPSSPMSRMISFPQMFYEQEVQIAVKAGQSASVTIDSDQPVPAGVITARLTRPADGENAAAGDTPNTLMLGVAFPLGSTVDDLTALAAQPAE